MVKGKRAPVGQACTHSPHATQVESPIVSSKSKTILLLAPLPAIPITSLTWTSLQARTHKLQWIQASRLTSMAGWLKSDNRIAFSLGGNRLSLILEKSAHLQKVELAS